MISCAPAQWSPPPGGMGTIDELFETRTLIQTVKIAPIPIVLFGQEFWRDIINFEGIANAGVFSGQDIDFVTGLETTEAAWTAIRDHYGWLDLY